MGAWFDPSGIQSVSVESFRLKTPRVASYGGPKKSGAPGNETCGQSPTGSVADVKPIGSFALYSPGFGMSPNKNQSRSPWRTG